MTLKEEAVEVAPWAEEMLWKLSAQAAQPAPQRLTEAEITLLVEAYYEDFGSAPPDLIRQVESLIFGDAQPAHAHAIDRSPERVEKQAGDVQVPIGRVIYEGVIRWDDTYPPAGTILYAAPSTKEGQQ